MEKSYEQLVKDESWKKFRFECQASNREFQTLTILVALQVSLRIVISAFLENHLNVKKRQKPSV